MNIHDILAHIINGTTPPGYEKREIAPGIYEFVKIDDHGPNFGFNERGIHTNTGENIAKQREQDGLDAFRQAIHAMIQRRTGVDFSNLTHGVESVDEAQRQHDQVMREQFHKQHEPGAMFERVLKQKTFDLGNATMCDLPKSVLKVLKMLLNGAGEAAVLNDEREFDTQIDAFNGLMLASGMKINCL